MKWRLSAFFLTPQGIIGLLSTCHLLTIFICLGKLWTGGLCSLCCKKGKDIQTTGDYGNLFLRLNSARRIMFQLLIQSKWFTHQNVILGLSVLGLFLACSDEHQKFHFNSSYGAGLQRNTRIMEGALTLHAHVPTRNEDGLEKLKRGQPHLTF